MRKTLVLGVFVLAMMAWSVAQQPAPGSAPGPQAPGAMQQQNPSVPDASQSTAPGASNPSTAAPGSDPTAAGNAPITEGCLGGSAPNYTLTDKSGTTYKLSFPSSANTSPLSSHIGESVQVMGQVSANSIDVTKIGKGTGTCPAKK